jgi:hypothetical protein
MKFDVLDNIDDSSQLCCKQGVQDSGESEEAADWFDV